MKHCVLLLLFLLPVVVVRSRSVPLFSLYFHFFFRGFVLCFRFTFFVVNISNCFCSCFTFTDLL